jgi:hypothetical protein
MTEKLATNREALLKLALLVRPALATQAYIPALTHIRFEAGYATAYNDIAAISVQCPAEIERCVPGELLIRGLSSFGGESVYLQDSADGAVVLSSGRAKLKLPTLARESFPFELPKLSGQQIELSASILRGIERCLLSVGNDPTHPAQMGVTLDTTDAGRAILFSTDNFTVSRYQTKTSITLPGDAPVILPTFFCNQLVTLSKAFSEAEPELWLVGGALVATFGPAATLFTKTLVDLEPLDFPRIISKHCPLEGIGDMLIPIPDAFDGALGRALLVLSGEVDKVTTITISPTGRMTLKSSSSIGDADDSMSVEGLPQDTPDQPFHVDPTLVARAVKVAASIGFGQKVIVLADADNNFIHLIAHSA